MRKRTATVFFFICLAVAILAPHPALAPTIAYNASEVFNHALDVIRIRVYTADSGAVIRDMRDKPFSNGIEYYGRSRLGYYSAFIRIDDVALSDQIDCKADVLFGMYYSPDNSEDYANHWGNVPIMVVDGAMFGAYNKDLLVNDRVVYTYRMTAIGATGSFWLHLNLATGQVKVYSDGGVSFG